jgi:uncharacterized protein
MSSPHRPLDPRSGLVLDTRDLGRRAGAMKVIQTSVPAPANLGIDVIGVPPGSPIELDVRLESVIEGVLVTGSARVLLCGECVRCLIEISSSQEVDIQELYVYPGSEATEEEASRLEGDLIDLEPLLRDEVVLDLPFQPVCRPECAGLCVECGVRLDDHPGHTHAPSIDPRWTALRAFEGENDEAYDVYSGQPPGSSTSN